MSPLFFIPIPLIFYVHLFLLHRLSFHFPLILHFLLLPSPSFYISFTFLLLLYTWPYFYIPSPNTSPSFYCTSSAFYILPPTLPPPYTFPSFYNPTPFYSYIPLFQHSPPSTTSSSYVPLLFTFHHLLHPPVLLRSTFLYFPLLLNSSSFTFPLLLHNPFFPSLCFSPIPPPLFPQHPFPKFKRITVLD
jgi:hypothetical protein